MRAEQEYFLIDQKYYKMRSDLRSLDGHYRRPHRGPAAEDQYFGSIKTGFSHT